jgi:hypothetical protein
VLNEPQLLELSNVFLTASCSWLAHLAASADLKDYESQIQMIEHLPLPASVNRYLSYTPEFLIENVINFLTFLGRFNIQYFEVIHRRRY